MRRLLASAALLVSAGCASARPVAPIEATPPAVPAAEPEVLGEAPAIVEEEVRAPARDILGAVEYDLPVEANSWVEAELDFLVGQRSGVIRSWLERGDFYEPYIKDVLRAHGVPTDLYHLAMIESGFVPTARSRAGAVGMWQFMPSTGRAMGLRVDATIDERMDPIRSTRAAARHLRSLHRELGDWALAAAAYNAGSGRITRGLRAFGATDFWDLAQRGDLAEETKHYVPRLYAVTVIARDRARFGFPPPPGTRRFAVDSIQVEYATPLRELAALGGLEPADLARLNPHLIAGSTPAGGYWVWVPAGKGAALQRAWLGSDFRKHQGFGTYTVRWGDNLSMLAHVSGVPARRIRELNPAVDFDRLQTGEKLKLPFQVAQDLTARPAREPSVARAGPAPANGGGNAPAAAENGSAGASAPPPATGRAANGGSAAAASGAAEQGDPVVGRASPSRAAGVAGATHRVEPGETLWGIAREHGVEVAALQELNGLSGATIQPGQTLRLPARSAEAAAPGAAAVEHVVAAGESLWGIARRYGSTIEAIEAANQLGERPIQPGQRLVIPGPAVD